ncbi:MAG: tRNA (guanosine(46)-N7)-methyltransferase TrmB [Muribaculaceae bacterium]|nr:tRNA (guanosine(46)-N7)-methyltransferase TrmB [Muribaculaceae bacterium]
MGKNKLKKFREMETIDCVFQAPYGELQAAGGFPMRGQWRQQFFHNDNPIVLELGCGKGEYTVGLARRFPGCNFIGIDIKGARMWTGACQARDLGLANAAFIRTNIELLDRFFAPGEVDRVWITFPDPQMKKARKRLTGTNFLNLYRKVMKDGGTVNLKTDSPFLYTYTREMAIANGIPLIADTPDLYASVEAGAELPPGVTPDIMQIRTFYEQQWLARGLSIKYLAFHLDHATPLVEPDVDIPPDTYRSFSRGVLETMQTSDNQK